jgi:predicted porin
MKKTIIFAGMLGICVSAHAQNSVTLYGLIESGLTYSNNQDGHTSWQMVSGTNTGSRWGLKGAEDLGGGYKTIFTLESGFDSFTGALGQGGRMFGRQVFVGMTGPVGTVTVGRQYDAIYDGLGPYTTNYLYGGGYFSHANDVDNTDGGFRVNNAVKYVSPVVAGFTLEGFYSLGGVAGDFSNSQVWGVTLNYAHGPLSGGVGYERINNPATVEVDGYLSGGGYTNVIYGPYLAAARNQQIAGAGVAYALGNANFLVNYTHVLFAGGQLAGDAKFDNFEVGAAYSFTPALQGVLSYNYTDAVDDAASSSSRYHQINLMADYALSKRTDVYAQAVYQHAVGAAQFAQIAGLDASSSRSQLALRVAFRHRF